jgi:allantoicase
MAKKMITLRVYEEWLEALDAWIAKQKFKPTRTAVICESVLERISEYGPDREHRFDAELSSLGLITHVRFNIFPDGGVNRLRLFGVHHVLENA